jgi:hypothetical protein
MQRGLIRFVSAFRYAEDALCQEDRSMSEKTQLGEEKGNPTTPKMQSMPQEKNFVETPSMLVSNCPPDLRLAAKTAVEEVSQHLNDLAPTAYQSLRNRARAWWTQSGSGQRNPVRIKNLEKVLAHLNMLQHLMGNRELTFTPETCEILAGLLSRLEKPEEISFNQAWEIADQLEAELLWIGDVNYIKGIWLTWPRDRIPDPVRDLVVKKDDNLTKEDEAELYDTLVRSWLLEDQRDLVQEYRRERAMITLRRSYLNIMAITLLVLDIAFCWLFVAVQPFPLSEATAGGAVSGGATWPVLLLIVATGAIGSVLARATRLSQQPLPASRAAGKGEEVPLGIRSLMSTWSVFWAQVVLGATAALIVFLVFSSGLLNIEGLDVQTPATLAVLSFFAGFSEPFFLDVVGKISGRVS